MCPASLLRTEQQESEQEGKEMFAQGHDRQILAYLTASQMGQYVEHPSRRLFSDRLGKFANVQNRAFAPSDNGSQGKQGLPTLLRRSSLT